MQDDDAVRMVAKSTVSSTRKGAPFIAGSFSSTELDAGPPA